MTRRPITHWLHHERPSRRRLYAARPEAMPSDNTEAAVAMRQAEENALQAGIPRPRFPFRPADVVAVYRQHQEVGQGVWFRVASGRIFSDSGELADGNPAHYRE